MSPTEFDENPDPNLMGSPRPEMLMLTKERIQGHDKGIQQLLAVAVVALLAAWGFLFPFYQ